MSLVELKEAAKNHTPKIKHYYVMKRHELIQLLTMNDLPAEMVIAKKTLAELRKEAEAKQLPNRWKLRRAELVELLYPQLSTLGSKQNNQNHDSRKEHNHPQKGEGKEVGVDVLKDTK